MMTNMDKRLAEDAVRGIAMSAAGAAELVDLAKVIRDCNNSCCGCGWPKELADILENAPAQHRRRFGSR